MLAKGQMISGSVKGKLPYKVLLKKHCLYENNEINPRVRTCRSGVRG